MPLWFFDLIKVLTPVIPLFSRLLGSLTFSAREEKLQERKAVAEERLGVLRVSECLTLVERAERSHLMCEARECNRKLVALYYGHYALAFDEATGKPRRKGDTGLHLEVIAVSLLWSGVLVGLFSDYPSSAAGDFASRCLYVLLVLIGLFVGELLVWIDIKILRKHRVRGFGWLYDIYYSRELFLKYFLEDENLSDAKGHKKEVEVLSDQGDSKKSRGPYSFLGIRGGSRRLSAKRFNLHLPFIDLI